MVVRLPTLISKSEKLTRDLDARLEFSQGIGPPVRGDPTLYTNRSCITAGTEPMLSPNGACPREIQSLANVPDPVR